VKDKRGVVIGRLMVAVVVLLFVIIISASWLFFVWVSAEIKSANVPSTLRGFELDSVLLDVISVNGEEGTVVRAIIEADLNSKGSVNPIPDFKRSLKEHLMKKSEGFKGERCFILCHNCNDEGFPPYTVLKKSIEIDGRDVVYKFADGKFIGNEAFLFSNFEIARYSEAELHKRVRFSTEIGEFKRNYDISYYNGKCYSGEEFSELGGSGNE
jgi:hypothetical protein